MHALEVIIARNDRAAGRALAHADNDADGALAGRILVAQPTITDAFYAGYNEGLKDR